MIDKKDKKQALKIAMEMPIDKSKMNSLGGNFSHFKEISKELSKKYNLPF